MKKWLLIVLMLCGRVQAQQGYTFNRISTEDALGLSSNSVYSVYQDKKGFLWIGTANGLQRFDGSKFLSFGSSKPATNELPVAALTGIIPEDDHWLWLFFASQPEAGLFNTQTYQYERIPIEPSGKVPLRSSYRMWKDSNNELYLIIWKYGILRYNKTKKSFCDQDPFHFPSGWISGINVFEDTLRRQIWFPCPDSGILIYDQVTREFYNERYNPKNIPFLKNKEINTEVSEIFIDSRRRHWIFNWPDVHKKRCFAENGSLLSDTAGINQNNEYSELSRFFETSEKVLWVYGANGLFNFDEQSRSFHFYKSGAAVETGITYQAVNDIFEDRDGSIWIATDNGLYFTSPGSGTYGVVNILFDEKKGAVEITDLLQLSGGEYWLATWGRGIITLDKQMNSYKADLYKNIPPHILNQFSQYQQVWSLHQNRDGDVWLGCQEGYYLRYDTATATTQWGVIEEAEKATIRYITSDPSGNLFFATQRGHLIVYNGKKFNTVQMLGTIIFKVMIDTKGYVWLATLNDGLYCLSSDGKKIIRHYKADSGKNQIFMNSVSDIDQINDSTIAAGAGALNLVNLNTGTVSQYTFDDGLPGNSILRIRADKNGNLWIITLNGLCKFNSRTGRFTPYGRKDGITLAHLTGNADFLDQEGFVLFTGANALMYFKPELFENRLPPPDVVITDFKIRNEYQPVDSLLQLPRIGLKSGNHSFTIYFSSLSYSQKEKLTYYYKMEGIDDHWIKADRQLFVNYPILPPGEYIFTVYSENIEGVRSKHITSIRIYIRPPFWRTWWFYVLALLVILTLVFWMHRQRIRRLLAVEGIRNKVARDLHDDMGSTLSTINILSSMAKAKLNTDMVKTSEYINKISDNSQRMMEAMDDIVWAIKPANDNMTRVLARMREFATSVLEAKEIELKFTADEQVKQIRLGMEARRDLFLVFKEAVNNVAKYSKCRHTVISLKVQQHNLLLEIADDGTGFEAARANTGNGLGNMRKRAEAMGGKIEITSAPGTGTTVRLQVPVG